MKKIIVGTTLLAAAACGGVDETANRSTDPFCQQVWPAVDAYMAEAAAANPVPDDPRYGGTAVVATVGEIVDGMNAAVTSDYAAQQHHQFVNLMTLIDYDDAIEPRPYLAERWEVNDDVTEITFHLREDVFWHDGEQTTAADVAFTYETVTNPATAFPNAAWWNYYEKGADGVEVIDDFTIKIRLQPHAEYMDPFRVLAILPEHLLHDVPPENLKQHPYGSQCPVGNGPFTFVSHAEQDRWVFRANPGFSPSLGGRPFLDRYVYRVIPEQATLLTELLTEGIDVFVQPRPTQAPEIEAAPDIELRAYPFRDYVFVGWNARRPQLADARVRRAITMGTDRATIVESILGGYGSVANSGVPSFHYAYDPQPEGAPTYDPDGARALLDEAGWIDRDGDGVRENADGVPLRFSIKYNTGNQQRQRIAELMQSHLAEIGMDVQPEVVEWATLLQDINTPGARNFDGVVMGWVAEFKLDDTDLFHSERLEQPFAWSGTDNPEIDRLLDAMSRAASREEAAPLWAEYQTVINQEQPYTYFYFRQRLDGVNRRLQNVVMDARGEWVNIREWHIDPESR